MSTGAARPSPSKRRAQSPGGSSPAAAASRERGGKATWSQRRRSPFDSEGEACGSVGADDPSAPGTCPICGAEMKGPWCRIEDHFFPRARASREGETEEGDRATNTRSNALRTLCSFFFFFSFSTPPPPQNQTAKIRIHPGAAPVARQRLPG